MQIENYKELYEERAGIMQFDGKMNQQEAEKKALAEIVDIFIKDQNLKFSDSRTYNAIAQFKKQIIKN